MESRGAVFNQVLGITPWDAAEVEHRDRALLWIDSGTSLWRGPGSTLADPVLCCYFVIVSDDGSAMLLIDHVKSGCRLPPGGHVEVDEDPRDTVCRECREELALPALFHPVFGDKPFFVTFTVGTTTQLFCTLWFVLADPGADPRPDSMEIGGVHWVSIGSDAEWPDAAYDPHIDRFRAKLADRLSTEG